MTKLKSYIVAGSVALFILVISLLSWFLPAKDYSDSERRKLAQFPGVTWSNILDGTFMTKFESYSLDQFPGRDGFRTLKSINAFYVYHNLDNNDIYVHNGYAPKLEYPLKEDSIQYATDRFTWIYNNLLKDGQHNIYTAVIPDKGYYLSSQNGYLAMDYEKLFSMMKEKMPYSTYIDLTDTLTAESFYQTDTHWRMEKIQNTAKKIAAAMGVELKATYTETKLDQPFYGVYYGQSALPLSSETIYYMTSDLFNKCTITNKEDNNKIMDVYDMEKAHGKDPYQMFLGGSISLITIENPEATTDRELVIFRDSFGSSITPYFAEGYAKITVVDIRYLMPSALKFFVDFGNADILFMYSTLVLNNSETIK